MIQGSVTLRRVCEVFRRNGPWLAGRGHFLYAARRSTLSRFLKYKIIAMVHNYGSKHIATSHTYWPTNRRTKGGFLTFDLATTGTSCGRRGEPIVCALEFCSCAKDFPFRVPLSPIASYYHVFFFCLGQGPAREWEQSHLLNIQAILILLSLWPMTIEEKRDC